MSLAGKPLSPREREVLTLTAEGREMDEIGAFLFLALNTVRTHRLNIYRKLGARNAAHAVHLAYQRGDLAAGGVR